MSIRSDHKALLFLGGIAVLGATVRAARAVGAPRTTQPALERQMQAADSAKRTQVEKARKPRKPPAPKSAAKRATARATPEPAPVDQTHRDYRGRLDLDVATATEVDALPGVGPTLAKRIVVNRMANGPFRELIALRRVKGITPKLLTRLDSLVGFSGIYKPVVAADSVIVKRARGRS